MDVTLTTYYSNLMAKSLTKKTKEMYKFITSPDCFVGNSSCIISAIELNYNVL